MNKVIVMGIAGASGSGKSLLANTIASQLGSEQVAVISEDAYYKDHPELSFEERANINYDHPDAFEHDLLYQQLLALKAGHTVNIPQYHHSQHRRTSQTQKIGQRAIIIFEGILLFTDPAVRELMDIRIYMDTPLDICLIRRLRRDIIQRERTVEAILLQYEQTVRPMYLQFIEPSKRYADVIVPRGGENLIAIDIINAKMRELLSANGSV